MIGTMRHRLANWIDLQEYFVSSEDVHSPEFTITQPKLHKPVSTPEVTESRG